MAFWKESMINRLSNLINRNRSAAKISQVLCSNVYRSKQRIIVSIIWPITGIALFVTTLSIQVLTPR